MESEELKKTTLLLLLSFSSVLWGTLIGKVDQSLSRADLDNLVHPVVASPLGSTGTEWISCGGFQPDGTLVLAGVTLGPGFDLPGVTEVIIGQDQAPPAPQDWPMMFDNKGNPRLDKDGKHRRSKFDYQNAAATGFVVRIAPDFKQILSATRFPWSSGPIMDCAVDSVGGIYLAGYGKNEAVITSFSKNFVSLQPPEVDYGKSQPAVQTNFLVKLSPDTSKVEWLRFSTAPQSFPLLKMDDLGRILFKGLAYDLFDASGKWLGRVKNGKEGFKPGLYDINPRNGEYVYGHEHHWPTGREPWRCPELKIFNPDGTIKIHLYDIPGPVVGSDASRLVSDSAVRNIQYIPDGNLLYSAWSDGGNSIMYNQPHSLYQKAWNGKEDGLRLSAAGAGVMSFAYVLRLNTQTFDIDKGTLWASSYKGVESARITALLATKDRSVALAGSVYGHLYRTPNAFPDVPEEEWKPGSNNVSILNPNFTGLRFSSNLRGCGNLDMGDQGAGGRHFGLFSGISGGKEYLVVVSGAENHPLLPKLSPVQDFAGGHLDGYFCVIDMSGN